jgi:2-succinyl-6-hydroxy-2,4-cyclohexadiene-1-carboxylate synthase
LLHGFSETSSTWERVAPSLAQGRYVVAPDLVGHGRSDRPGDPAAYDPAALLDMLAALLGWLQADRADFVGYSMGGRVALLFACAQPCRVASLVLESTGLGPATEEQRQAMLKRDRETVALLQEGDNEAFADFWEGQPLFDTQKGLPADLQARIRATRVANDPRALALMVRGAGQHAMPDLSHEVVALPMGVLYIAGIHDRRYRGIAEGLQREGIASVLLDTGHNAHLEAPKPYIRHVKKFLESSPLHAQGAK